MTTFIKFKNIVLSIIALLLLFISYQFNSSNSKPAIVITKQQSALNISNDLMNVFSLGQKRLLADFLWISTLLESDLDHYKNKDLNSWMFLRFKSIISIDPDFYRAYQFGGKYLSIIKDDLLGADYIYTKGLLKYPENYVLLNDAAFLYTFELKDFEKGLTLYEKVSQFPHAPTFLKSLIIKLRFGLTSDLELILPLLLETYKNEQEGTPLKEKMKKDIYAVKSEIDLKCLNSGGNNCSKYDYYGAPYIYKNGTYITSTPFKPYRTIKTKN